VTLTVDRESQSPDGRLTHSEDADGLNAAWEQGDQLLFCYNHTDKEATAQTLTLQSIDASDASVATFAGTVTIPASAVTENSLSHAAIAYLGKSDAATYRPVQTTTYVDLTQQDGRFDAMAWNDAMSLRDITLAVEGNNATAASTLNLNHHMAFAHFKANLPAGSTVTISGNTYMRLTLNIPGTDTKETAWGIETTTWAASQSLHVEASATSRITVPDGPGDHTGDAGTGGSDDPDGTGSGSSSAGGTISAASHFYVALLPFENPQEITFTATDPDGNEYTATLEARQLEAGHYYRAGYDASLEEQSRSKGIYVNFTEVNDDPEPSPADETVGPTFTITDRSGNDISVRFTRANLHFNTTTREWYIPEKQTDFKGVAGQLVGNTNTYRPAASKEIVDLFRWGATGYDDGSTIMCKPELWKENTNDQSSTISGTFPFYLNGSSKNYGVTTMRNEDNKYADWGFVYSLQELGTEDDYYTLTWNEFSGVLDTYVASMGQIGSGTNAVKGIIIFNSTDYEATKQQLSGMGIATSAFYNMNSIFGNNNKNKLAWTNIILPDYETLETLNAVFLPMAGHTIFTGTYSSDIAGYWTATANQNYATAFGATVSNNKWFNAYPNSVKNYAIAVRLVRKVTE